MIWAITPRNNVDPLEMEGQRHLGTQWSGELGSGTWPRSYYHSRVRDRSLYILLRACFLIYIVVPSCSRVVVASYR